MNTNNIFDDIIGNVTKDNKISTEKYVDKKSINEPVVDTINCTFKTNIQLNNDTKNKLIRYLDLINLTKDKLCIRNIDFKLANEMFAMLPEIINKSESIKLTRLPSENNLNLVNKLVVNNLDSYYLNILDETVSNYNLIYFTYTDMKTDINLISNCLQDFITSNKAKLDYATNNDIVVLNDNKLLNINKNFIDEINAILKIYDPEYSQAKQITDSYKEFIYDQDLDNLITILGSTSTQVVNKKHITLVCLLNKLTDFNLNNTKVNNIEYTYSNLLSIRYEKEIDGNKILNIINSIESTIEELIAFKCIINNIYNITNKTILDKLQIFLDNPLLN